LVWDLPGGNLGPRGHSLLRLAGVELYIETWHTLLGLHEEAYSVAGKTHLHQQAKNQKEYVI